VTPLVLDSRAPISLAEVLALAPATVRVDRKYLVPLAVAQELVDVLPAEFLALEIDGRRWTSYRSTYFDTADLATCRAHIQGRRRRWKFRSRLYVEDGTCRLEVKVADGTGLTRKYFHGTGSEAYGSLDDEGVAFLADQLLDHGFPDAAPVAPTLEVAYRRATLAVPATGERLTIDHGVRAEREGHVVELDRGHALVETKGGFRPGAADRLLVGLGARPRSFSKYVAGVALTHAGISDNDLRHLVGRELHVRSAA
jgi:hypothetical protein